VILLVPKVQITRMKTKLLKQKETKKRNISPKALKFGCKVPGTRKQYSHTIYINDTEPNIECEIKQNNVFGYQI